MMIPHVGILTPKMPVMEFLGVKRYKKRSLLNERHKKRTLTGKKDEKGKPIRRAIPL